MGKKYQSVSMSAFFVTFSKAAAAARVSSARTVCDNYGALHIAEGTLPRLVHFGAPEERKYVSPQERRC